MLAGWSLFPKNTIDNRQTCIDQYIQFIGHIQEFRMTPGNIDKDWSLISSLHSEDKKLLHNFVTKVNRTRILYNIMLF